MQDENRDDQEPEEDDGPEEAPTKDAAYYARLRAIYNDEAPPISREQWLDY